jgi:hypothetical protein
MEIGRSKRNFAVWVGLFLHERNFSPFSPEFTPVTGGQSAHSNIVVDDN